MAEQRLEILLDGVPYSVTANPFSFNDETRYQVFYNGVEHIFAFDPSLGRLAPIDADAANIPDHLESAIARRLVSNGRPA